MFSKYFTSFLYRTQVIKSFIIEDVARENKEIREGDIFFAGSGETAEEIGKAVA